MTTPLPDLAIGLNATDYSRYAIGESIVTVRGVVGTAKQGQTCTVSIARDDAYGVVATQTIPSVGQTFTASFDLNGTEVLDADGFNRVVQGDYTATAALADGTITTAPFTVSIVSVSELRNQWLYGLTSRASEIVLPKQQPTLTPTTFLEVSPSYVKDYYPLVFTAQDPQFANNPSLSFAGGPALQLNPYSGIQTLVLLDEREADWARVQVDTFQLPTTNQTETIVLDQMELQDKDFITMARLATDWVETQLGWYVEPRLVVSPHMTGAYPSYERINDAASFYDDFNPLNGVFPNISLPFQFLQKVYDLKGWYNQQQVLTVPAVWIQNGAEDNGNIELVPTSGQASALTWQSFPFAFTHMQSRVVPGFWQYACLAGLRDLTGDRGVIREAIAKKAGINLALAAASAYRAGISSQSTSRDNVSFSQSFTASAMYSTFAHLTIPWQEWLQREVPRIKQKIGGIPVVTMA